jgi:hypothetical protein
MKDNQRIKELTDALRLALEALNTARRFKVPSADMDSYDIAALCEKALNKTKP